MYCHADDRAYLLSTCVHLDRRADCAASCAGSAAPRHLTRRDLVLFWIMLCNRNTRRCTRPDHSLLCSHKGSPSVNTRHPASRCNPVLLHGILFSSFMVPFARSFTSPNGTLMERTTLPDGRCFSLETILLRLAAVSAVPTSSLLAGSVLLDAALGRRYFASGE